MFEFLLLRIQFECLRFLQCIAVNKKVVEDSSGLFQLLSIVFYLHCCFSAFYITFEQSNITQINLEMTTMYFLSCD